MSVSPKPVSPKTGPSPIDRSFAVLQVVVAAEEPLGVREIGRRTGLPRSTASRLVAALEQLGMIERTANALVAPGSALATLQPGRGTTPMTLRDQLRPLLNELAATFGENAALAVDDGDAMLYIGQVAAENPVSVDDVSGERHPFHLIAPGILTIASWRSDRLDKLLSSPLESATENSMVRASELRRRLKTARREGFVWTDQELDVGINGLAVGIVDANDQLIASTSLYGPSYRFSPTEQPGLAQEMVALVAARAKALLSPKHRM